MLAQDMIMLANPVDLPRPEGMIPGKGNHPGVKATSESGVDGGE